MNPPLVLVVDDFEDGRTLCAEYLQFRGYRVATAEDGQDALDKAFELRPDLILMDLSLPILDGWEATRRLRRDARTEDIPVVALTAHALQAPVEEAKQAGCVAVLTKPIEPAFLASEVQRILAEHAEQGRSAILSANGDPP
jgi:two-component system cell cycle response regulator DivK